MKRCYLCSRETMIALLNVFVFLGIRALLHGAMVIGTDFDHLLCRQKKTRDKIVQHIISPER